MEASSKPVTQFELTPEIIAEIRGAFAEVDRVQMAITRQLTPAQRAQKGLSMSDAARRAAAFRLRQRDPSLSEAEASRMVLAHIYAQKEQGRAGYGE